MLLFKLLIFIHAYVVFICYLFCIDTRKHGLQIMGGGMSSITSRTSKNSFNILKEDPSIFSNYPEVQATWMFFQQQ
jgi:hypothetical protein